MSEEMQAMSEKKAQFSHSSTIGEIAGALAKAHSLFKPVIKGAENPYFKSNYADLASLIEATQAGLSANGLHVIQSPGEIKDGKVYVTTMLIHSSGEWFRDELGMPMSKADAQGAGSAITYARRYAYQSVLNVAGEDDDDGNAAVGRSQADRKGSSTDRSEKDGRNVNPTQQRAFWAAVKQGGKTNDQVAEYLKSHLGIEASDDIPKVRFDEVMKWAVGPIVPQADLTPDLEKSVAQATMKRIFALAGKKGVPEADVKQYAYETFKVDSMTKLSGEQLLAVANWVDLLV